MRITTVSIVVCDACGTKVLLSSIPTLGTGCQTCGNYGTTHLHKAVVVEANVPPAERYSWTPWLWPWIAPPVGRVTRERVRLGAAMFAATQGDWVERTADTTSLKERVAAASVALAGGQAGMVAYLRGGDDA